MLNKNGRFSEISRLQGDGDMGKKYFPPPEASLLSSGNKNFHHKIIPKNSIKISVDVNHPSECKGTHLNKVRKEQNPDISNLNSMPGKLQIECPYTGSMSCAMGSINSVGNNVITTKNRFGGWMIF